MKLSKLVEISTMLIGGAGTVTALAGGASCIIGLTGTGVINLGKALTPYKSTLEALPLFGYAAIGGGFLLTGTGALIVKATSHKTAETTYGCCPTTQEQQAARASEVISVIELLKVTAQDSKNSVACHNCRHYHGATYNGVKLTCAIHPCGWEDWEDICPDWQHKKENFPD